MQIESSPRRSQAMWVRVTGEGEVCMVERERGRLRAAPGTARRHSWHQMCGWKG